MSGIVKPKVLQSKKQIPMSLVIALLFAIIMGLWLKSYWDNYNVENILFENITLVNPSPVSVDVLFTINNKTNKDGRFNIFIQVYTTKNKIISSRLTTVEIKAKSQVQYIKELKSFERRLEAGEMLSGAIISLDK